MTTGACTLPDKAVNHSLQRFKAEFFKALAHPTRIRILELLRNGEKSVGELQQEVASEGSTVSQQLAILRMKNVVDTRKVGNVIYYRLRDPLVNDVLDVARRIFDSHVIELQSMTDEAGSEEAPAEGDVSAKRTA
jgi:DNA-binding transcriptional ArsR family regulator